MRTIPILRRIPWLAAMLVSCSDDGAIVGDDPSSETSEASISGSSSTTPEDTSTADDTSTESSSTESSSTESSSTESSTAGDPNTAPEANDDTLYATQEQELLVASATGALANDVDIDGDALVIVDADVVTTGGGTVDVDDDGSLTYTPAPGFFGSDSFGYTVSDGTSEASAVVTVHVAPVLVQLASVADGIGGFVIDGEEPYGFSGWSVSGAGDVNGDGLDDLVVGAVSATPNGFDSGRTYVVFGKADHDAIALSDVAAGVGGFTLDGEDPGDQAGSAVDRAGDINGDGLADVVIGTMRGGPAEEGRSYVVFGKVDTEGVALADVAAGIGGFAIDGAAPDDRAGYAVGGAGDVDGDGRDDLVVGAHGADPNGAFSGRSYVVLGKADTDLVVLADVALGTGGFAIDGETTSDDSGFSVAGAGDVNGDDLADVVIGAFGSDANGEFAGRSYVVFGKSDTELVALADVTAGTGGFAIDGAAAFDRSGYALSSAGDVDGDGLADVMIGAHTASAATFSSGRTFVVLGKADTDLVALSEIGMGMGGFVIEGDGFLDESGTAVGAAGDLDGDGFPDVLVGAPVADMNGQDAGRSYVVYGTGAADSHALFDVALGVGGFALDGEATYDRSGSSIRGAGDVNGDGLDDFIVGAWGAVGGAEDSGRSYVVFGVPRATR